MAVDVFCLSLADNTKALLKADLATTEKRSAPEGTIEEMTERGVMSLGLLVACGGVLRLASCVLSLALPNYSTNRMKGLF